MQRPDGRAPNDLRPVKITSPYIPHAEGSALFELGRTKVVATATVEAKVPAFLRGTGQGWVTAEYAMLPRATTVRTPRDSTQGRIAGRSQEIQRMIGRSLRATVSLGQLGEYTVWIDCDVIEADGGTRTACVCAGFVALVGALRYLQARGQFESLPLKTSVAATSVGIIEGTPCLDLCYAEDAQAEVDLNVVMTGEGLLVEIQGTAEGHPFSRDQLGELLDLAGQGIGRLIALQDEALGLTRPLLAPAPASG